MFPDYILGNFPIPPFWCTWFEKLYNTRRRKVTQQNFIPSRKTKLTDDKLTKYLVRTTFSRTNFDVEQKEMKKLSTPARELFHFIVQFAKLNNVCGNIQVYMLKDPIQKRETDTCRVFQMLFYDNLFALK